MLQGKQGQGRGGILWENEVAVDQTHIQRPEYWVGFVLLALSLTAM